MGAIDYQDGSYLCAACKAELRVPAGAQIRRGYTTVDDGARERIIFANGTEIHRCAAIAPDA
jgi:hypothetical protein